MRDGSGRHNGGHRKDHEIEDDVHRYENDDVESSGLSEHDDDIVDECGFRSTSFSNCKLTQQGHGTSFRHR